IYGAGMRPRIELMLTIRPAPWRRMPGSTAWIMRRTPMTLVSNSACAWLMLVSSTAPTKLTPALLISTSIRAARLRTSSTQAFAEASSRTSSGTSSTPARGRVVAGARTPPNTRWPRVASTSAVARPMPDDAPVIRTTRLGPFVIGTPGRAGGWTTRLRPLSSPSAKDVQDHLLAVLWSCRGGRSHALFTEAKARHTRENPRKRQAALQPQRLFRGVHRGDHERCRPHPRRVLSAFQRQGRALRCGRPAVPVQEGTGGLAKAAEAACGYEAPRPTDR